MGVTTVGIQYERNIPARTACPPGERNPHKKCDPTPLWMACTAGRGPQRIQQATRPLLRAEGPHTPPTEVAPTPRPPQMVRMAAPAGLSPPCRLHKPPGTAVKGPKEWWRIAEPRRPPPDGAYGSPRRPYMTVPVQPIPWKGCKRASIAVTERPARPPPTRQHCWRNLSPARHLPPACAVQVARKRRGPPWRTKNPRSDCAVDDAWGRRTLKTPTVGVVMYHRGRCRR